MSKSEKWYFVVLIIMEICAIPAEYYIHTHLRNLGVTFITVQDVIGVYVSGAVIVFFSWVGTLIKFGK